MRRLLLTENITADGRIEMLDEWFNPSPDGDIQDWLDAMRRLGASSDAVLLGRQTFEDFRGYWPQHTDEQAGAYLDQVQKYIVSSSMTDPQWRNSTILSGDPVEEVRRLKDSAGGDITLSGSITLAHAVLAAGLVDEIRLVIYPAIQGRGKCLVAEGTSFPRLELLESRAVPFRRGAAPIWRDPRLSRPGPTQSAPYPDPLAVRGSCGRQGSRRVLGRSGSARCPSLPRPAAWQGPALEVRHERAACRLRPMLH